MEYFEKHVRPLLAEHCYKCHSSRSQKREGGLLLDSMAGWSVGGGTGPAIVVGDVEASLLISAVRYTDPDLQMPPDKALAKGSGRGIGTMGGDRSTGSSRRGVGRRDPAGKSFRSDCRARPLGVSAAGTTVAGRSCRHSHRLASIANRLLRAGTAGSGELDASGRRRSSTLVRRVYFQLVGLPPTPEQVAAFLNDDDPDAYERLVDQLLNSPQFGQRWGRHWLDLARYADSNGLDENFLFREAWRYRNWVIDAVNADVPFDRFLLEQIAGDLLPYESVEQRDRQRIAAGFLAWVRKFTRQRPEPATHGRRR